MTKNEDENHQLILLKDGTQLKEASDFKYRGSKMTGSKKDFTSGKEQEWYTWNKLHQIWLSGISLSTKLNFFRACLESVLLFRAETWTMKKQLQDGLHLTYTRFPESVQNLSCHKHQTKADIYEEITPVSTSVAQCRVCFAGHGFRVNH